MPNPPPPTTNFPIAAKPRKEIFDPWNSSATGHQRAENRLSGSTSWRDSRTLKLAEQFKSGHTGGKRVADTVGAGSESFVKGERTANGGWVRGVIRDPSGGQINLWQSFGVRREGSKGEDEEDGEDKRRRVESGREESRPATAGPADYIEDPLATFNDEVKQSSQRSFTLSQESHMLSPPPEDEKDQAQRDAVPKRDPTSSAESYDTALLNSIYPRQGHSPDGPPQSGQPHSSAPTPPYAERPSFKRRRSASPTAHKQTKQPATSNDPPPQVFRNLTIYINGSTYPTISDHKLKHLLVTHGANISIMLGRRSVTHVILGRPAGTSMEDTKGAGGALAAGKIQKEIVRVRSSGGNGVKFVGVEWVLACVEAGRRVGEREFEVVGTGPAGVKGVHKVFGKGGGTKST